VLVVVEDRDLHPLLQLPLDVEALRGLDIFEIDAAQGRFQGGDHVDQLVRVPLRQFDIEDVDASEFLEQAALAFHDWLGGEGAYVTQAEDGGAIGDDANQVGSGRVISGRRRMGDDGVAGGGDPRGIGQCQVALVGQDLGRADGNLTGGRPAVIFEGGLAQILFH
jgi:hypothetical protein